jgi:hypothetical protein
VIRPRASPLILGFVVVALAGCGEPGVTLSEDLESFPDSPSPTPSAEPTPPASASPSVSTSSGASPTSAAGALEVDGLAEVLVTDLVVRTAPGVEAGTSTILADRLTDGDRLFVVDGPVDAAGYAWYLVAPLARADESTGPFGWIAAASREGEPWVRSVPPPCPGHVDLAAVLALQPLERLACFGADSLMFTAPQVPCGVADGPWSFEPAWLAAPSGCGLSIDASEAILFRVPPGVTDPGMAVPLTIRGHFDDPAASRCRITSSDDEYPAPTAEEAVVRCRTEFVVEAPS